jgi:hypothetical protein
MRLPLERGLGASPAGLRGDLLKCTTRRIEGLINKTFEVSKTSKVSIQNANII